MQFLPIQTCYDSIIQAIVSNDVNELKKIATQCPFLNLRDQNNNTALHLTLITPTERETYKFRRKLRKFRSTFPQRRAVFEYLLTLEDAPIDAVNSNGETPLMEAFTYLRGSPTCATLLIEGGCDINGIFPHGDMALHCAIKNGWFEVAELLIENGFDVNARNIDEETALFLSCKLDLTDEIWMLLFYGADPNMAAHDETCFDIAASKSSTLHEIFFDNLKGYPKVFHLDTFMTEMKRKQFFPKILEAATRVVYNDFDLAKFIDNFSKFRPDFFKLFIEKFDYVISDVLKSCPPCNLFISPADYYFSTYTSNLFSLFDSKVSKKVVRAINSQKCSTDEILFIIIQAYRNDYDLLTKMICCMLSYGVNVTRNAVNEIYFRYGHCELFKMLLHMEIVKVRDSRYVQLVPEIMYCKVSQDLLVKSFPEVQPEHSWRIFEFFTFPDRVKNHIGNYMKYHGLDYNLQQLPTVPSLRELSRNVARSHIIDRYKIKNNVQFYTVLRKFPIAEVYKKIISFEKRLYNIRRGGNRSNEKIV